MLARYEGLFNLSPTTLPDGPDMAAVEDWLLRVRRNYLSNPKNSV